MFKENITKNKELNKKVTQKEIINNSLSIIPPLWPLDHFVAVNPFLGKLNSSFIETAKDYSEIAHEDIFADLSFYKLEFDNKTFNDNHIEKAIEKAKISKDKISTNDVLHFLNDPQSIPEEDSYTMYSVSDLLGIIQDRDLQGIIVKEISHWLSTYFDKGQALWTLPWKEKNLFEAWKDIYKYDKRHSLLNLGSISSIMEEGPENSKDFIFFALEKLNVPDIYKQDYLQRLLLSIPGWSGYIQYLVREDSMSGKENNTLIDFLAILTVYELALIKNAINQSWYSLFISAGKPKFKSEEIPLNINIKYILQTALEISYKEKLLNSISTSKSLDKTTPKFQSIFCIDVRSEVMRRNLESISNEIETIGFAGFFGFPISFQSMFSSSNSARCPVLLSPGFHITETYKSDKSDKLKKKENENLKDLKIWNVFKSLSIASFSFVETFGPLYTFKLIKKAFASKGFKNQKSNKTPDVNYKIINNNQFGLSIDAKNQLAYNALKNMGLIDNFAKLIFIAGHGSETENNPYGSGLDCGACGGHAGDVNARVAALVLNEKPVREYLKGQGINIPDDTIFVAGMHNTTTDEFTIYDEEQFQSPDQKKLISEWKNILKSAGEKARLERAPKMGLDSIDHKSIFKKSVDWSETRPEWGLAGNACFIAGSRDLTKNINLQGRSFLHNYDYTKDKDGKVLELIMTAPLVVASWINLQYYASSANNKYFGSGTKTTHNLTGKFAVMQGNSGDLQVGLPFQSVHNGKELVHKPQRLNTIIQAPVEMIKVVLKNHPEVTRLFDNNWIYFTAIDPISEKMFSYEGDGNWELVN